ncbi:MAG: hypothetical protein V9H25_08050 [Candidatus Competibacter sp.]
MTAQESAGLRLRPGGMGLGFFASGRPSIAAFLTRRNTLFSVFFVKKRVKRVLKAKKRPQVFDFNQFF